jgi:citrate lyase beta subunit
MSGCSCLFVPADRPEHLAKAPVALRINAAGMPWYAHHLQVARHPMVAAPVDGATTAVDDEAAVTQDTRRSRALLARLQP